MNISPLIKTNRLRNNRIKLMIILATSVSDPCTPNPCGPNSVCRASGTVAHCSCRRPLMAEPACRPECRGDSECPPHLACRNEKCRDPCPGACGQRALCRTVMHSPICTCPQNYIGDPFVRCLPGKNLHLDLLILTGADESAKTTFKF